MSERLYWQIGAGARGRDYSEIFIDRDVMFLGPGQYGAYDSGFADRVGNEFTPVKINMVKWFVEDIKPGHIVLMRRGDKVLGIGVAADELYQYDTTFDDVYGWNLSHTRRIRWQSQLKDDLQGLQLADGGLFANPLAGALTRVRDNNVIGGVESLIERCDVTRPLKENPPFTDKPLDLDEVGRRLFAGGLANSAVNQVLDAIERQRRLLNWYKVYGKESNRPDEQEVVAHMVLPLLIALGWSEQLLAIEWRRVDLAGFSEPPTTNDRCVLVCEAKGLDHGLMDDINQAMRYIHALQLTGCKKVLITQGGRFYLYRRPEPDGWPLPADADANHEEDAASRLSPVGYINVEKIRTNHIAPAGTDAIKTLIDLTPAGIAR